MRLKDLFTAGHDQRPVVAFLRSALMGYGIQMIGLGLGFIVSVLIARALGPDGRGTFAWMMTLNGVVLPFAMLGLDTFVRQRGAGASREVQSALLGTGIVVVVTASIIVGAVLYLIGWQTVLGGGNPRLMALAVVFAPFAAACSIYYLLMMAQKRMLTCNLMTLVPKLVTVVLLIGLLVTDMVSVRLVLFASLVGTPVVLLWLWIMYRREGIRPRIEWGILLTHKKFVGGAYVSALLTYLLQKQDVLLMGAYVNAGAVGHYSVANTFVDVLLIAPMLVGLFLLPHLQSQPSGPLRRAFAVKVIVATGVALSLVAAIGIVLSDFLVTGIYGPEFSDAVPMLQVLLVAFVMFGMLSLFQNILALQANGGVLLVAPAVGALLNLVLNIWWLPTQGAMGAAWASVLAYGVAFALAAGLCRRMGNL